MIYHHTSTLRTNLLWMAGVVEVEGRGVEPIHPHLGPIQHGAGRRRAMNDFPAVAWFTRRIDIPKCLLAAEFYFVDKSTGGLRRIEEVLREHGVAEADGSTMTNAISMNRVALGFDAREVPVVPWPEHAGYATAEGRELNESARGAGDNPDEWLVSETPVDLLRVREFWSSRSIMEPKLSRVADRYVDDIHRMVKICREQKAYIPPSWMSKEHALALARALNAPVEPLR